MRSRFLRSHRWCHQKIQKQNSAFYKIIEKIKNRKKRKNARLFKVFERYKKKKKKLNLKKKIFSSRLDGRYIEMRHTWNFSLLYIRASLYKYRATTRILWSSITYHIISTRDLRWPCKAGHRTRLSTPIKQRC